MIISTIFIGFFEVIRCLDKARDPLNVTTIAVQQYIPMDICSNGNLSQNAFTGIEVDIIKDVMKELGKSYGKEWQFFCVGSTDELTTLLLNDEMVLGGISGFSISSFFPALYNFTFTQSYFDNQLAFVSKIKDYNFMLVILRMFSWEFTICFVLINIVCAVAVYFWEGKRIPFYELFFHYFTHFFGLNSLRFEKIETRILDVVHLVLNVIIFSVVVSFLIENTSISAKTNGISTPEDLRRKTVVTFPEYKDFLEGIGIKTELNPDIDIANMESILSYSNRSAILVDEVVGFIAEHIKCTLFQATKIENPEINKAILVVGERKNFRVRTSEFYEQNFRDKRCDKPPLQMNKEEPLKWDEMWYIWIPFGVIVILGFFDHSIIQLRRVYNALKSNRSFNFSKIMIMNSKLQKQLSSGLKKLSVFDKNKQLQLKKRYLSLAGRDKFDSQLTYNVGKTINSLVYDMKVAVTNDFFEKFSTLLIRPERRAQLFAQKLNVNQTFDRLTMGGPILRTAYTKSELEKNGTLINLFQSKGLNNAYDPSSTDRNLTITLATDRKHPNNTGLLTDRPFFSNENQEPEELERIDFQFSDLNEGEKNQISDGQFFFRVGDSPFISPRTEKSISDEL